MDLRQNTKSYSLVAFCSRYGQAFVLQTHNPHEPRRCFQTDRHVLRGECWRKRELASHVVPLPLVFLDDLHAWVGTICSSMRFAIGTHGWWNQEARTWSSTILSPHVIFYEKRPVAVITPMRFSSATTFIWRTLQAPQMQDARMSPEQARKNTLHSLKATMLSIMPATCCSDRGQKVSAHSQRKHVGRRIPLTEPPVKIYPLTLPMRRYPNIADDGHGDAPPHAREPTDS